jgi:hypothetical protein
MSSTPRKPPASKPNNLNSPNSNVPPEAEVNPPVVEKEQWKYGDVKVTTPGVGKVSIVIH